MKGPTPTLVVVSGPPGSGKTTRAHAIAVAIPCPAICRDDNTEGMVHAHGRDFQGGHGDPLTQRTFPLIFEVLRVLLAEGVTVVAEAAFQDRLWRIGLEPLAEAADLRFVHCNVEAAVSWERAVHRLTASQERRRAHGDSTVGKGLEDWTRSLESFDRVSIPAPSIEVDTTDGYEPSLAAILEFVNRPSA